jgi:hypothetical protein
MFLFWQCIFFPDGSAIDLQRNGAYILPFGQVKLCLLYADDLLFFIKPDGRKLQILKITLFGIGFHF